MARIAMLRVALGLARMSFGDILVLAEAVLTGMTDNLFFPNPPVDMNTFKAALEHYKVVLGEALDGGKRAIPSQERRGA